jgi:hypothetical protein
VTSPVRSAHQPDDPVVCHQPVASNHSMPTINHLTNYFSTPSAMLSAKPNQRYPAEQAGSSSSSSSWAPVPPVIPPQMEEFSSIRFSSMPFYEEMHCLIQPTNLNPTNHSNTIRGIDGQLF